MLSCDHEDHLPCNRAADAVKLAKSVTFIEPRIDLKCSVPHRGAPGLTEDPRLEADYLEKLLRCYGLAEEEKKEGRISTHT